jgi:ferredoxin
MKSPLIKFKETKFIRINVRQCNGCRECIEVCPEQVLGMTRHAPRTHIRVLDAESCTGCKKCVKVCKNEAILYTYMPPQRQAMPSQANLPR